MKKKLLMLTSLLAVTSIAACANPSNTSSNGDVSTSEDMTGKRYATMTVEHSTIPAGGSFYDTCKPTLIYHDKDGTETNYTDWKNVASYKLVDKDGNEYTGGEALKEGEYTAIGTAKNKEAEVKITVTNGNPEKGAEGKGYKTYYKEDFENLSVMKHQATGALGAGKFPSLGKPKMIVVPVIFKDMAGAEDFTKEEIEVIEKAFFGEASDTSWQSVKSFYKSSSYGNLEIEGEVAPEQYVYNKTVAEAERQGSGVAAAITQAAANWYIQKYNKNVLDYDSDRDGYIDGVNIIYKTTAKDKNDGGLDMWWNYTSCATSAPNIGAPTTHRYFFSEFKYISTSYYTRPNPTIDAHTLIHENGHLLGLNDYYSYDKTDDGVGTEAPGGCSDMMDMNVGDHNGYSKMLYNWLREKKAGSKGVNLMHVDGSSDNFTLRLNSFTDEGDLILIRNTTEDPWNKTPYDEYIIMQYYTPTGVNTGDMHGYGEWKQLTNSHGGTYEYPGLQVFHVDSRLAAQVGTGTDTKNLVKGGYEYFDPILDAADPIPENDTFLDNGKWIGAPIQMTDNTGSRSKWINEGRLDKDGNIREISAILSSGVNGLKGSSYYTLFGAPTNLFNTKEWADAHDDINFFPGSNTYSNFRMREFFAHGDNDLVFNDGSTFNWTVSVEQQDETGCTLHFVNNDSIK